MTSVTFDEEFQILSNLPESLDYPFLHLDKFAAAINKLRRKSKRYKAQKSGRMDYKNMGMEALRFFLSQPKDPGHYRPVKMVMILLAYHLDDLLDSVDSGSSVEPLKVASEIDHTLYRLGSLMKAIDLCSVSVPLQNNEPVSITHVRNRHLLQQCQLFLETLTSVFIAYLNIIDERRHANIPTNLRTLSRARLDERTQNVHDTVDRLMDVFEQPSVKLFQDEWMSSVNDIENVLAEASWESWALQDEEITLDPNRERLRKQLAAFVQFVKLCRLLMNKLYKYTNRDLYLGSYMCFRTLVRVQAEMCRMIKCLPSIFVYPSNIVIEDIKQHGKYINVVVHAIKVHWFNLPEGKTGTEEMLRWLRNWTYCYRVARKKILDHC